MIAETIIENAEKVLLLIEEKYLQKKKQEKC